ncbi:DNA polymerase III subunit epsilon [Sphingomonas melonis]|uniref:3'-5' exonuclease n=1 Tax=Sphingomonas melonis TaxID=152682 RepID=UPI001C8BF008|nr:3'-5' exonuclease [Sphingomonas melonis]MBX8844518.1 DNA polymerase III subunit epsilon [Sphingomonas melonis]MBX8852381.1 DNA polymerase III subunit epsilon [Sphingomonas melonis]MBX8897860.1 DNA polymerase III subunit epsilon [Sphingomonas melonis]
MDKLVSSGRIDAAGDEKTRVLHRLDVQEGPTGEGNDDDARLGVAIDVETTGTVFDDGVIIELAVRPFRFDRSGVVTHIGRASSWREDPGRPLTAETTAITGLTDGDLAGRRIDDAEATDLMRSASLVVAHHAAFDRPYVERRLEGARGLDWACTFRQVDWRARGFDGRTLGYLIQQAGYFYRPHRAAIDVDAVIQMLRVRDEDGRTVLAELVAKAEAPSWIVSAEGASFEAKDALKSRGYRWDPDRRVWWTEIADDARTAEEFWLAANVYGANRNARSMAPRFDRITAAERFL